MDFVKPEYNVIYNKIKSSNKLINFLTSIGGLITKDDFYKLYGYNSKKNPDYYVSKYNNAIISKLTSLFLDNEDYIKNNSIYTLINNKFLFDEIKIALEIDSNISLSTYKEIYYEYKNIYADNFFQNNWMSFLPEIDEEMLENNQAATAMFDAFATEFDKIDEIITQSPKFRSYEDIPDEYINYLSQMLGVEQKTFMLEDNQLEEFRVLAANIIEIYKQKGEFAAFELMFNLLGYKINITQYYFDRRKYFDSSDENTETDSADKNSYKYYLTTNNPILNISDNFTINETVSDKDMTERYNLEDFDVLVEKYGLTCVLGIDEYYTIKEDTWENGVYKSKNNTYKYNDKVYKYFKTNYVRISPSPYGKNANFKTKQLYVLHALLDFLVPYFWKRDLIVNVVDDNNSKEDLFIVNGYRNSSEENPLRILDGENWINFDENIIADEGTPEYSRQQLEHTRQQNVIKEYILEGIDNVSDKNGTGEYYILHDDDIVVSEKYYNNHSLSGNYTAVRNGDGKIYYVKNLKLADNTTSAESNKYYNSLGEHSRRLKINGSDEFKTLSPIMEPIGKKIITINSTKYWGKIKENENSTDPLYPIWIEDYVPVEDNNPHFYPAENGEVQIYIPKYNSIDISNEWKNMDILGLVGFEGNTLKKKFLNYANYKQPIKWIVDSEKTLAECIDIKSGITSSKNENFFETAVKSVQNLTWKREEINGVPITLLKDTSKILEAEKELFNLLNRNGITFNNLTEIYADSKYYSNLEGDDYKSAVDLIEYIKENSKYMTVLDFANKHNVINFDYINNCLYNQNNINQLSFNNNKNIYNYNIDILNNIIPSTSYYLQQNDDNTFYIYKAKEIKGMDSNKDCYNKYIFKELYNSEIEPKFTTSSISDLNYVEVESNLTEHSRLIIEGDKTYFLVEIIKGSEDEPDTYIKKEITPGTIIYVKDTYIKYIAELNTTNLRLPVISSDVSKFIMTASNQEEINTKDVGSFYYDGNTINQVVYKNIKKSDLIYSPKEETLYEITSNGVYEAKSVSAFEQTEEFLPSYCNTNDNTIDYTSSGFDEKINYSSNKVLNYVNKDNLIFGIKKIDLSGVLKLENNQYNIYQHDKYYRGVSEQDDNDNYILNNNERYASWNALSGCETNYLKNNKIERPIRSKTDRVFDEALVASKNLSTEEKINNNDNKKIVENLLHEIIGKNFLTENELIIR